MKHINNNGCPPQKIIGRVALVFLSIYLIVSRHISFTALFIFAQKIFFVSTAACRTTINQCYQISNIVFFTSSRWIFMFKIIEILLCVIYNHHILCYLFCRCEISIWLVQVLIDSLLFMLIIMYWPMHCSVVSNLT